MLYSATPPHFEQQDFDLIIDVRSPSEFKKGHIPEAINLPVLDDVQHREIGTLYKKNAFEATRKGAALVTKNVANYLDDTLADLGPSSKVLVCCWRGGERSHSLAHILSSIGWSVCIVKGGYKAYRKFTMEQISDFFTSPFLDLRVVAGNTGTGKTAVLHALQEIGGQTIDLEKLANHRGSLFGSPNLGHQPSQRQFETLLLEQVREFDLSKPIFIEAESNKIGRLFCPPPLWQAMKKARVVQLESPIQPRVNTILRDYAYFLDQANEVNDLLDRLVKLRGAQQVNTWKQYVVENKWSELVKELLECHYDKAYQEAGTKDSSYLVPQTRIELSDCTSDAYRDAAHALLKC